MKKLTTMKALGVFAGLSLAAGSASAATVTLISEDWDDVGWTNGDISTVGNDPLSDFVGYGLNNNNPTTLLGAGTGGNVRRDVAGFDGVYGSGGFAGSAVRVRSSNGAMLNENPLALASATSVTMSFDLYQQTANYHQVVEYSSDQAFTSPVLLDTITGDSDFNVWIAKSYTVTTGLTDDAYFRIRKLRPSPSGTNGGANGTYHRYDNILITAEVVPEPSSAALLGLGGLALILRRRK
ncbi:MAG: PEP-CTERM sorting domain-containing protein [Akkermansiaceae bacterium]